MANILSFWEDVVFLEETEMNHRALLRHFLHYVQKCIEDTTERNPIHPMSFDEWYNFVYLVDEKELERVA